MRVTIVQFCEIRRHITYLIFELLNIFWDILKKKCQVFKDLPLWLETVHWSP